MRKFPYFKTPAICDDGSPAPLPLRNRVSRRVRFEEVDSLSIVWHGHYSSYFEDGRVAFGRQFGLHYIDMKQANIIAPVKNMHIDYIKPLYFDEECTIETCLHWSDASRLNFCYYIYNSEDVIVTKASTIQLFLNFEGALYMAKPTFYANFCDAWRQGKLTSCM